MTRHRTSLLVGIATIALAVFPAEALELNAGPLSVSVGSGGGGASVNASVNGGSGGGAGGGGGGAALPGGIGGGAPSVSGAPVVDDDLNPIILPLDGESDPTTVDVDVDLDGEGEDSITGSIDTGLGDADAVLRFSNTEEGTNLNVDTDLDAGGTSNEAMIDLTIGGGGFAGEATVGAADSEATLSINVGTGGVLDTLSNLTNSTATTGETAAVPGTGVVPAEGLSLSASGIESSLETISEEDVAALKVNCRTILGNSASYSANAVAICKLALGM